MLKRIFQERIEAAAQMLAAATSDGGPALLVGAPWRLDSRLYNATLLLDGGHIAEMRFKCELPNYGVFDEKRIFAPGPPPEPVAFRGARLGVMICEDMWAPRVAGHLAERGAELLVIPNGSPFETDKPGTRQRLAAEHANETGLPLIYVNLVGGQDELVFDGASFTWDPAEGLRSRAPACRRCYPDPVAPGRRRVLDMRRREHRYGFDGLDAIYHAMTVVLRDYVAKNRFPGVVLGLSGGIDSALSAAVAVDALGAERCTA